ncbi:MAG: hypothetical protein ACPGN3_15105, partial [Opitutales bacterium]
STSLKSLFTKILLRNALSRIVLRKLISEFLFTEDSQIVSGKAVAQACGSREAVRPDGVGICYNEINTQKRIRAKAKISGRDPIPDRID